MLKLNFAILGTSFILASAAFGSEPARVPVLLELFTSEGCSSCPPADLLLEKLDRDQPIAGADLIILSEHVDYWNRLGWADPYSSSTFSRRQQAYAEQFHADDIYTPQLVVDGVRAAVGGNWPMVKRVIEESLHRPRIPITVKIARTPNGTAAHVEAPPLVENGEKAVVYMALAANRAKSHVTSGENSGHELTHVAVVSSLRQVAKISEKEGVSRDVPLTLHSEDVRVVVFIQDARTQHILGVARANFSE